MTSRILLFATMDWPTAARYAGGFVAAGCEVYAACPTGSVVRLSRYVADAYDYDPLAPLTSLRQAIAAAQPNLIVACDDRAVSHLVRLHAEELEEFGEASSVARVIARSLGNPENYARIISRSGSLTEMKECGIRVAETLPVENEAALESALHTLGLPAVLKSDGSWGGEGVVIAQTREEAIAAYRKLAHAPSRLRSLARSWRRKDAHFLRDAWQPAASPVCVQKFIAGFPSASAFAAEDGKVLARFHYDVLVADQMTGPPNVIRRVNDTEMDTVVRVVAERFGLTGLHGLDYIRDAEGNVHLIEINPRATQGGTLPFGAGRDLPSALAQTISRVPVGQRPAIDCNLVAFYPREMRRDPRSPYLRDGYHDVPRDDPEVWRALSGAPPRRTRSRKEDKDRVLGTAIASALGL